MFPLSNETPVTDTIIDLYSYWRGTFFNNQYLSNTIIKSKITVNKVNEGERFKAIFTMSFKSLNYSSSRIKTRRLVRSNRQWGLEDPHTWDGVDTRISGNVCESRLVSSIVWSIDYKHKKRKWFQRAPFPIWTGYYGPWIVCLWSIVNTLIYPTVWVQLCAKIPQYVFIYFSDIF